MKFFNKYSFNFKINLYFKLLLNKIKVYKLKKQNYVSEEIQEQLINHFTLHNKDINEMPSFRISVELYIFLIKIFKYKIENNIDINFNNTLEYLFYNYKILKNEKLLSLDEIKSFEKFIIELPSVKLRNETIKCSMAGHEYFTNIISMPIMEYLKESSFLIDFFHMKNNIENF